MMEGLEFHIVDAFVDPEIPFSGNPAAVVILHDKDYISDDVKQKIAAEFNLSETVYLSWIEEQEKWLIRWITPQEEVKLCGHATVAASFILFKKKLENEKMVQYKNPFQSKLEAAFDPEDDGIVLNFPSNDCQKIKEFPWLDAIKKAVVGQDFLDQIVDVQLSMGAGKLLIRLKDHETDEFLRQLKPNTKQFLEIDNQRLFKGIIVTMKPTKPTDGSVHFWSRYFAPWVGITEDPVTGSAHTVLTPYWDRIYQSENNRKIEEFHAQQVSKRSGKLKCKLSENNTRVLIKGKAEIFCQGTIKISDYKK